MLYLCASISSSKVSFFPCRSLREAPERYLVSATLVFRVQAGGSLRCSTSVFLYAMFLNQFTKLDCSYAGKRPCSIKAALTSRTISLLLNVLREARLNMFSGGSFGQSTIFGQSATAARTSSGFWPIMRPIGVLVKRTNEGEKVWTHV